MKKIFAVVSCLLLTALVVYSKTEEIHAAEKTTKVQRLVKSKEIKDDDFFVDAKWLKKQMKDDDKTVVIEASYGEGKDYKKRTFQGRFTLIRWKLRQKKTTGISWTLKYVKKCS